MKIRALDAICIWSADPDKLAKFYEEVLGLEVASRLNLPDDTGVQFKVGNVFLFIGYHDKISGMAKDPYRIMVGFETEHLQPLYEELAAKDVEFIQTPVLSPDKTFYVATALDPEGNIIQFTADEL